MPMASDRSLFRLMANRSWVNSINCNYYVAFSHSGATLGLIVGELLAQEILSGEPHPMLATFRPRRFV